MPDIVIRRECFNCGGDGYVSEPDRRGRYWCGGCQGTGTILTRHKQAVVREVKRAAQGTHWNLFLFDRQTGTYLESLDPASTDHEALLRLSQRINA